MREQLQNQIYELGISPSCILEHSTPDIVDKYCKSSIFVLSSRYEGFGMVIIEAMACGVPPVSFTCPCGPRDIISDGINGLLVENGNIEGLAEKICYLIENENVRREMGRQARMDIERFRIEPIAEQWKTLFESIIEKIKIYEWYTKYLQVYEQPFDSAPKEAVDFVKTKLQKLSENKQPLASVILICYNEEKRLLSCLWSLCDNICDFPIEILAVNNNSSDRTESVLQQLGVTYFNELKKGPGHARQCGLNQAKGTYHICIDTDTMYPNNYIKTHVKN